MDKKVLRSWRDQNRRIVLGKTDTNRKELPEKQKSTNHCQKEPIDPVL